MENLVLIVKLCSCLQSTKNLHVLSFFFTSNTGEAKWTAIVLYNLILQHLFNQPLSLSYAQMSSYKV
jgi:hypothetical protein